LVPEADINDMLWDVCLAYKWLCEKRRLAAPAVTTCDSSGNPTTTTTKTKSKIFVFGVSSGAALALRLLQSIAETQRGEATLPAYLRHVILSDLPMPAGAVLAGPYVDFTVPSPAGTLVQYAKHDLIVTKRVLETGLPYLETHAKFDESDHFDVDDDAATLVAETAKDASSSSSSSSPRHKHSPVYRSFQDIPPLCVVVSEHEGVYDQAVFLINQARAAGVPVTVGCWKYVCHVFSFLSNLIPEGEQSVQFLCEWLRQQQRPDQPQRKQQQQQQRQELPVAAAITTSESESDKKEK